MMIIIIIISFSLFLFFSTKQLVFVLCKIIADLICMYVRACVCVCARARAQGAGLSLT